MPREKYDSDLQMFVETKREPDLRRLTFLRWLAENNQLEHPVAGPPSGKLVVAMEQQAIQEVSLAAGSGETPALATQGDLFVAEAPAQELPGSDGLQPA